MKIISRGQKPEDKLYKGTCAHCKTVFECQAHEGKQEDDFREGGSFLRVTCPVCGSNAIAYPRDDGQRIPRDHSWPVADRYRWSPGPTSTDRYLASQGR